MGCRATRPGQFDGTAGLILPGWLAPVALLASATAQPVTTIVDPLTVVDDDFARHRDPRAWDGLQVERVDFSEERATWRLYRIVYPARSNGPLWFVPHDNENAGFEAALVAIRRYGGTIVAIDANGQRLNANVAFGRSIDPNRNFHDGLPLYAQQILAAVAKGAWPIVALHTNGHGYDPTDSLCPREGDTSGQGVISIRYCDDVLMPSASRTRAYPFDDDDTLAFATYLATRRPGDAFCRDAMVKADWNVVQERVANTDGSLSNYAALRGIAYLNFETREQGPEPAKLAAARDRLTWMIDHARRICPRKHG